jgi:FKBP-type peptidyl-prolyl cis-trans isomerase
LYLYQTNAYVCCGTLLSMKKYLLLPFVLFSCMAYSQKVDYNKIILPTVNDSTSIQEKLVQLAWKNYPINEVTELGLANAKKGVTLAKLEWANHLSGAYNLNEFTIKQGIFSSNTPTQGGTVLYPRYNVGLQLSLGSLISTPVKVKREKIQVKIAEAQIKTQKLSIRAEVLKRYQVYLTSIEVLKLRFKAAEEAHLIHLLVTKKFKKGEAMLEDYNKSSLTYNNAQESRIHAESEVYLAKTAIEEMIGLKLEEVTGTKYDSQKIDRKGDTIITASGLKYIVNEPGFGEKPKIGQTVKVLYTGKFLNGKPFENNLNDEPFRFTLGVQQVIQGWEEGILLMHEGEKGTLIIPAKLAYGHQGIRDPHNEGSYLVPPDTPVMYEIELIDMK